MGTFESKLTEVGLIESRGGGMSLMSIMLETYPDVLYMIGDYVDTQDFINKDVIVDITKGFHQGKEADFINNISVVERVVTLDKVDNVRLYPDTYPKNECSVNFKDIAIGDPVKKCAVYCTNVSYESSFKSNWRVLTILDSDWRIAHCKQFTPDDRDTDFVGKYILAEIIRTPYGLQVDEFTVMENLESIRNPRIDLSYNYVKNIIGKDKDLQRAVAMSGILDGILNYKIDEDLEIGYEIVRLANELYVSESLVNISKSISIKTLNRYLVMSRLFMTKYKETSTLAPEDMNITLFQRLPIVTDTKVLALLSDRSRVNLPERDIVRSIKELSKTVVNADRTYLYADRRKL